MCGQVGEWVDVGEWRARLRGWVSRWIVGEVDRRRGGIVKAW